jgi:hypothetical protein
MHTMRASLLFVACDTVQQSHKIKNGSLEMLRGHGVCTEAHAA